MQVGSSISDNLTLKVVWHFYETFHKWDQIIIFSSGKKLRALIQPVIAIKLFRQVPPSGFNKYWQINQFLVCVRVARNKLYKGMKTTYI